MFDAFLRHQTSQLALVNQSSFLLASLTLLHLSRAFLPILQFLVLWLAAILAIFGYQVTMDLQVNQTPDLATILRTLASYTPIQPSPQPLSQEAGVQVNESLEEGEYDPDEYDPSGYDPSVPSLPITTAPYPHVPPVQPPPLEAQQQPPPVPQHQPPPLEAQSHIPPPIPQQQPIPPALAKKLYTPPATITTWPPALRYITSRTPSDPEFTQRIRHLISTQHTHERQWWFSRVDLIKKLEGRDEKKRKLDSVLDSIGGKVGPSNSSDLTPEKELEIFDRKVYRACMQMVAATTQELGKLEVPFFCTMKALVVEDEKVKRKGMIHKDELRRLQGKMLELVEDFCGEEQQGQEE